MIAHSTNKVAAYVRLLRKAGAPEKLIFDFEEIVAIDNGIAEEGRDLESLDRLLIDVCKRHAFARPFDKPGARAWLRPCLINGSLPECHEDTAWGMGDEAFNPVVEQAYRRGYDQGFDEARRLATANGAGVLTTRGAEISKWRRTPVFYGASRPGSIDQWGIQVSVRSGLPAKRRYDVIERDGARCVMCGRSAADGISLHVDHKIALSNGGSNEMSNLQTLCEECNLGKGKR